MADMSAYLADKLAEHAVGRTSFTMPATHTVKLHLGAPGSAGTANPALETTLSADVAFNAVSSGVIANTSAITWTNVSNAETYSHISTWDGTTGPGTDNCLFQGALDAGVLVAVGDDFEIPAGQLTITMA